MSQSLKIPAFYMRGGTSKGVFFVRDDLPKAARVPGSFRDALLLRIVGSPDPYGKHVDGMGGATSSTSKTVIMAKSSQPDHDVDYLFGQVAIDKPIVDWSGNCGNLTAAAGAFAVHKGLVDSERVPENGIAVVRIWQANIKKTIIVHIPIINGEVQESGNFTLDGVAFPSAEVALEFREPAGGEGALFPTGNLVDDLEIPGIGTLKATLINAGTSVIFLSAEEIGYTGTERQEDINSNDHALALLETIRAHGAVKMGLIETIDQAGQRPHTPKLAFVAHPKAYTSASGREISANDIDLLVRAISMGQLHHAMMGTAAIAISVAAAIPGTLVNLVLTRMASDGEQRGGEQRGGEQNICFGHPSGVMSVGAEVQQLEEQWRVTSATMSRSARVLMDGWVRVPLCLSTGQENNSNGVSP